MEEPHHLLEAGRPARPSGAVMAYFIAFMVGLIILAIVARGWIEL